MPGRLAQCPHCDRPSLIARGGRKLLAVVGGGALAIGWPYDEELVVEGDLPDPVDVPDGSALVSRALREHPRRRQLDAAVAASEAAVEAEDLET